MKHWKLYIAVLAALCMCGCGNSRKATPSASRYTRQPIQEVTQEQLDEDSALIEALSLQECGRNDEALAAYAALTSRRPTCAAAWYEMGQLLLQRGWTDSAANCTKRAVTLNGNNLWYRLAMAQVQQRRGDTDGLTATWEAIVKLKPDVLENYYELSNAYISAGDIPRAVEALNRVERMIGVSEPVSLQKQRLWEAAGKSDKAMKEVEALADAMPQEKRYQSILAELNMKEGRYSKAKRYYDRILAADPDDEYIHVQLAEYYKRINRPADADSEMVRAFRNPKLDSRTKMQLLASFYSEEELYGSSREVATLLMQLAMEGSPNRAEYALYYGDMLMRQQRYAEAAEQLELALTRDSSRYEVWEGLLICLSEVQEREDDMNAYAQRTAKLFPTHTLPLYLQGLYAMRHDKPADAIKPLEQAVKWGFTKGYLEAATRGLLAECYARAGEYDKAWPAYEEYLKLEPNDWNIMNNYAYFMSLQGVNLEKALQMSRRTIEAEPENPNNLDTYGWILHLLGRDAEGLPYMEKAARLNPKSDTVRQHLEEMKH
ncbi:MAG: tetratricopeptide repeat protein [Bacteroidales bacterium]|nr:tetratricopeptide repeat protein [Bacteroidales bacterium]